MRLERCVEVCRSKWVPLLGILGLGLTIIGRLLVGSGSEGVSAEDTLVRLNAWFHPQSPAQRAIYRHLMFAVNAFTPLVIGLSLGMLVTGLWARVMKSSRPLVLLALVPALNTLLLLAQQGVSHLEYVRVTWIPPPALVDIVDGALRQRGVITTLLALSFCATIALLALGVITNSVRILREFTRHPKLQT